MFKILSLFQSFEFSLVTLLFERWDVDEFPSCLLRVVSYRMTFTLKRKWKCLSCVWLSATPWTIQTMEFSRPDPGVSSLSLLQGTFPTQGSNPGLLHCRQILYQLSRQGSPRTLEWVAYPFSSRSSWPRNRTRVSCIAGGFFTNWAVRGAFYIIQL